MDGGARHYLHHGLWDGSDGAVRAALPATLFVVLSAYALCRHSRLSGGTLSWAYQRFALHTACLFEHCYVTAEYRLLPLRPTLRGWLGDAGGTGG